MLHYLVLVIHLLSQFEVEESHLVLSEMRGELDIHLLASIGQCPFRVVLMFGTIFTHLLDKTLCLLE